MTILLDPGHGSDTPGKRSPDGRFLEYAFNRDIAARVASKLTTLGLNTEIIVPELTDIPLKERVSRINSRCAALGKGNVILVSVHANAAGNSSKWMNARGWSCYTSKGDTAADALATCLCEAAAKYFKDLRIRTDFSDGDPDFEESFYILRHTTCPAVLVENFFYDNPDDLRFLESEEGRELVTKVIVEGVTEYLSTPPRNNTNNRCPS